MSRNRLKGLGAVIQILDTSGIDLEILSENLYRFSNNLLTVDMKEFVVDSSFRFKMNATSGGDQLKWYKDGYYIKADTNGYESISEALVSTLLSCISDIDFVDYSLCTIQESGVVYTGCYSRDICIGTNYRLISVYRLLQMYINDVDNRLHGMSGDLLYDFICSELSEITGLDMEYYINKILLIDYIIFNSDRHLSNIFVLYDADTDSFMYAPVLDNGAALFSNVNVFGLSMSYQCMRNQVSCKPFYPDFDRQLSFVDDNLYIRYDMFLNLVAGKYIGFHTEYYSRALNVLKTRLKETYGRVWIKKY